MSLTMMMPHTKTMTMITKKRTMIQLIIMKNDKRKKRAKTTSRNSMSYGNSAEDEIMTLTMMINKQNRTSKKQD